MPIRFLFSPETALSEEQVEVLCIAAWWDNDTNAAKVFRGLTPTEASTATFAVMVLKGALD